MAEKSERQKGKELARRTQESEGETKERVRQAEAKKETGETLTRQEAGLIGAQASVESTRGERREAERAGKGAQFEKEHRVETWTTDPGEAREPQLSREKAREAERVREKKERGETLTRREAGLLGGVARVEKGRGEE